MTNAQAADTVRQMMTDWNAATPEQRASALISARIKALIIEGIHPVEAARRVLGAELVDAMIEDVYRELRGER